MTNDQRLINGAILDVLEFLLRGARGIPPFPPTIQKHLLLIDAARRVNGDDDDE